MIYDVIIIGGGPAGLTAAIYNSRARLKVLLIESYTTPGQAVVTSDIENYPGFPEGISGFKLIEKFKKQAKDFGAEFKIGDVSGINRFMHFGKKAWHVELKEEKLSTYAVIVASGAHPRPLGVPGEDELRGKGVSYCAVCDAAFFKNKEIAVIGGGNTAIEEALFLAKFASKVTVIHRRERLRATKILQERALENGKIEFIWNSVVSAISGKDKVEALKIKNVKTDKETNFPCYGAFIFVGYVPNTDFLKGTSVALDDGGYILSDNEMKTSRSGVFVAGDVRKKHQRQIVTACGDGAAAAYSARMYVDELKGIAYK
ncbi:MAG: thioredoxin-disulfide reductase [Candidatus Omnitrophota bacterium]